MLGHGYMECKFLLTELEFRIQCRATAIGTDAGNLVIHPNVGKSVGLKFVGVVSTGNGVCTIGTDMTFKVFIGREGQVFT